MWKRKKRPDLGRDEVRMLPLPPLLRSGSRLLITFQPHQEHGQLFHAFGFSALFSVSFAKAQIAKPAAETSRVDQQKH